MHLPQDNTVEGIAKRAVTSVQEQSAASCEIEYKHNLRWKHSLASIVPGVVELICGLRLLIGCWVAVQERLEGHVVARGLDLHLMVAHEWHVGHLHGGRYFAMRRGLTAFQLKKSTISMHITPRYLVEKVYGMRTLEVLTVLEMRRPKVSQRGWYVVIVSHCGAVGCVSL